MGGRGSKYKEYCQHIFVSPVSPPESQRMVALKVIFAIVVVSCVILGVACQQQSSNQPLVETARTFGRNLLKRIGGIVIPAAFVVGAVTTLLAGLTMVSVNGLGVGVSILCLFYCSTSIVTLNTFS